MDSSKIRIGKITSPVGLAGEVKVQSYSDDPERYEQLDGIYYGNSLEYREVENVRYKGPSPILKIEGIDDRTMAERARGTYLYMDECDLPELEEDRYYVRDIIGFDVREEDEGSLGTLTDVMTDRAQDLYVVERSEEGAAGRPLLIPGDKSFILKIDTESRVITVRLPEGLLDL